MFFHRKSNLTHNQDGWIRPVLGSLVIVFAIALIAYQSFDGSLQYYMTVKEFNSHRTDLSGKYVKVAGLVVPDSIEKIIGQESLLSFKIAEAEATLPVVYHGLAPDTFKPGISVVVEGPVRQANGTFEAEKLITKCASKYNEGMAPLTGSTRSRSY